MILPGATLGILGGGQLGQMFVLAARRMGYPVWVLDPDPDCPAAEVANQHLCAAYDDINALQSLADHCAAVTVEFENISAAAMHYLETRIPVRPGSAALAIAQDRAREKSFFRDLGLDTAPFVLLRPGDDLEEAAQDLIFPAIMKTTRFGYDGKGQQPVPAISELVTVWNRLHTQEAILESRIQLLQEFSIILARSVDGMMVFYPAAENIHHHGVLDLSIVPARVSVVLQTQARHYAARIAEALEYVGVLAVEFFVSAEGRLLVNEMAPRPHNSGHYSIDACVGSQFDQQVRALCGLPLADTRLISPVVMMNLLGDLWEAGEPDWQKLLQHPQIKLHLYGKKMARPGRKMGHVNALSTEAERALSVLEALRQDWHWPR
ncbi:5-(carboxyamino)imidazole ribonucleotide synthase [Acidithiobacillus marinus]|uniref:N5-carboxyaminoimidazole ribonucleotide synthase n=1 Tax=Acidithiobacillus marinus TaxID=187490 RepID=A0A2I1DQ17_9PROT|nr:5-(carboxyamino)imidazole ribonucleotide synthase [Acidithiobacillus marinus]PKY11981.1 5-(carboxyamino)imidazole ribonucleotide synthase [Acidithiobacillus marinus]